MKINVYKTSIFKMLILTFLFVAGLCYSSFADSFENESLSARALINAIKMKKNERAKEILKEVLETPYIDGILKTSKLHEYHIYGEGVKEVGWLHILISGWLDILISDPGIRSADAKTALSDSEYTTYLRSTSFLDHALHAAIISHNNEIANELLKIPKVNPSYYTFRIAIFAKNNYMIEELLKTQHATYWINTTLLNHSFENFLFNNEISKKIIINNSNINVLNVALELAIHNSYYEMVQELLKNPIIKINIQDSFGETPLMLAIKKIYIRRDEIQIDEISKKIFNRSIGKNPSEYQLSKCYAILNLDYRKFREDIEDIASNTELEFNNELYRKVIFSRNWLQEMKTIKSDAWEKAMTMTRIKMTTIKMDDEPTEDKFVNSCKIAKVLLNDPRINLKLYNQDADTIWDLASPDIRNLLGISNK